MNCVNLILLSAALFPMLSLAQARRPSPFGPPKTEAQQEQTGEQPASSTSALAQAAHRVRDPFQEELARALEAEARWLELHEALMEELESLPPCGEQAPRRIQETRDSAFEVFTLRTAYLQRQESYAADLMRQGQEKQSHLAVDRSELEASAQQIQRELEAARRRRAELASSLADTGGSEENQSGTILDQLIAKLEQELRITQETLREFDQNRQHLRAITRWARERQRLARDQLDLIQAESKLWKAFYDGLLMRLELRCHESRPPLYQFRTRSPREVRP